MESTLITRLATLSHPNRMAVFRLLMRRCPDDLPAGEIAKALTLKASTASVYLSALTQAGLIKQRREGTRLLYGVNLDAAREVVADLFLDCCRGRADLCPPQFSGLLQGIAPVAGPRFTVLFICTGNSARSIMAETILRDRAGARFTALSAGTAPRSEVHPLAVETLKAQGHDVTPLRAKTLAEFQTPEAPNMDFVFTVCDRAANEDCPAWSGAPVSGHWGIADPAGATGTEAQRRQAFQQAYDALYAHITAFTALPLDDLDRRSLQHHVDRIAKFNAQEDH
ncbi:Protein ArsC [Roseovarius gaetbuli]|uniref:Protein ArsC n=1 Tax=Roseovarius gaetbuli TaxID=1356575 RepID=A0A1X6ZFR5_9RHOB|nr:helix-turn-helix domain-containing protein [Roseovarius gaetbuli]SLN50479.1 Protein ArsC [Roseovarius gaetbuli]